MVSKPEILFRDKVNLMGEGFLVFGHNDMGVGEDHVLADNGPSATRLGPSILGVEEEAADNFSNSTIGMFSSVLNWLSLPTVRVSALVLNLHILKREFPLFNLLLGVHVDKLSLFLFLLIRYFWSNKYLFIFCILTFNDVIRK